MRFLELVDADRVGDGDEAARGLGLLGDGQRRLGGEAREQTCPEPEQRGCVSQPSLFFINRNIVFAPELGGSTSRCNP
jgi:hypothetical protein